MTTADGWTDEQRRLWNRPHFGVTLTLGRSYLWHCSVEFEYGYRKLTLTLERPQWTLFRHESAEPRFYSLALTWLVFGMRYWHWKGNEVPPSAEEVAEKEARDFNLSDLIAVRRHGLDAVAAKMVRREPWYGREPEGQYWRAVPYFCAVCYREAMTPLEAVTHHCAVEQYTGLPPKPPSHDDVG